MIDDYKSFFELDNEGSVLYMHSDEFNIFMIYEDIEACALYRLILDKDFMIIAAAQIKLPFDLKDATFVKWNKPKLDGFADLVFKGMVDVYADGPVTPVTYTFKISVAEMTLKPASNPCLDFSFSTISCLNSIEVYEAIQKGNILFVIGRDKTSHAQVFAEVDMALNKAKRLYTLSTQLGHVQLLTINLDTYKGRLYLAGETCLAGNRITPYLEVLNCQ